MDKILRYSLFFLSIFFVAYDALSQDDTMQDVIFLKNGKKIKGYIISRDSVNIRIVEYGDKLTTVKDSDIVIIEKQLPGRFTFYNQRRFKADGFQSQVEGIRGFSTNNNPSNGFRFINGYKFKNRYFLGIGIGAMAHQDWGFDYY